MGAEKVYLMEVPGDMDAAGSQTRLGEQNPTPFLFKDGCQSILK